MTRREFLENSLKGAVSLPLLSAAAAQGLFASTPDFDDYKAVVVLHLYGGNDAFNTFIPTDDTHHSHYADARKKLAVALTDLTADAYYKKDAGGYYRPDDKSKNPYAATAPSDPGENGPQNDLEAIYRKGMYRFGNDPLGINGLMPELASLYEKKVLSVVSNVGTLVKPTTRDDIVSENAELPLFLFGHDHQRRAVFTAYAQGRYGSGWLGRVADRWSPVNGNIGLNVSYHGLEAIMAGESTSPLVFGVSPDLYKNPIVADAIERFAQTQDRNLFESLYKRLNLKAKKFSDTFEGVWDNVADFGTFSAKNSYGETLFSVPRPADIGLTSSMSSLDTRLFRYLESIARFIKIGKDHFGFKRQAFYLVMGGFDFHSGQILDHAMRLRSLSLAIGDFYKALEEMGLHEKVVLATTSDFGRTLLGNGDGTDHGWGGHQFILCGDRSFNGGKILGKPIADYRLNDTNTHYYPSRNIKGRLIPTTSVEQMFAPILDWFGVDESTMAEAFPNLENFRTDANDYKSAFLAEVFS